MCKFYNMLEKKAKNGIVTAIFLDLKNLPKALVSEINSPACGTLGGGRTFKKWYRKEGS